MRLTRHREAGSATVELAVVLPIIALFVAFIVQAGVIAARTAVAAEAAGATARSLARGESEQQARSLAARVAPGSALQIDYASDVVCVTASVRAVFGPVPIDVPARVCAPAGGR
ncbi:TadE family type IV pilus minor pilin [Pseudoclavibacter soli]|uniref:TadE family type IV pilus minor pilin n=1 Tax=Pseudoclavibacter soli TaxID=452623 RepID=UPI000420C3BB|nr:TadE family type IV pilus minor pilin [Pseudoclavibacter soli]